MSDCEELVGATWRVSDCEELVNFRNFRSVSDCEELVGVTHRRCGVTARNI